MTEAHTLQDLLNALEIAITLDADFVVSVAHVELTTPEHIFNATENLRYKKQYYENAYNNNLELYANNDVKIVGWKILTEDTSATITKLRQSYDNDVMEELACCHSKNYMK